MGRKGVLGRWVGLKGMKRFRLCHVYVVTPKWYSCAWRIMLVVSTVVSDVIARPVMLRMHPRTHSKYLFFIIVIIFNRSYIEV